MLDLLEIWMKMALMEMLESPTIAKIKASALIYIKSHLWDHVSTIRKCHVLWNFELTFSSVA